MVGETTGVQVEVVSTPEEQNLGLGNRFALPEGMGMLFLYDSVGEHVFWMKHMYFSIDIIWIKKGRIVHVEKKVPPPAANVKDRSLRRYGRGILADMVLEVPAGYFFRKGFAIGNTVKFLP